MHIRLISTALALSLAGLSPIVFAQSADLVSASVSTCNVKGSVSITALGITTTLPVTCINPSQETGPGNDEDSTTGNITIGVPGVVSVADLAAPYGESNYVNALNKTWLAGGTTVDDASLVQDMVAASGVRGLMTCDASTGDDTIYCSALTEIAQLWINGQPVTLPPNPIPLNHALAITGGAVQVIVLGIPISVPVSGTLTLNEGTSSGVGTQDIIIEHAPLHVRVNGSANVLGIGIVGLAVDVADYSKDPLQIYIDSVTGALKYTKVGWLPPSAVTTVFYSGCTTADGSCSPAP